MVLQGNKMISIKDFMECINYRITEGSDYLWACYGSDVYQLDSWNGKHNGPGSHTINIVFDTQTQIVYEMQAWDHNTDRAYRWIHPDYVDAVKTEYLTRGIDFNEACDDLKFTDLDVEEDIIEKATAIAAGSEYDERVQLTLDLTDEEKFRLMSMAHEKDMTLNQFVEHMLESEIERLKQQAA